MAPTAPSPKVLERGLVDAVRRIWNSNEKADLSVNLVRQRVETDLGLEEGFFKDGEWKGKSKEIIKDAVDALDNGGPESSAPVEPSPMPARKTGGKPQPKKPTQSKPSKQIDAGSPKRKRAPPKKKKVPESDEDEDDEDDDEDDELDEESQSDSESEEEPPKKKAKAAPKAKTNAKAKAVPAKTSKAKVEKPSKAKVEKPSKAKVEKTAAKKEDSADSSLSEIDSDEVEAMAMEKSLPADPEALEVSSSEESIVIDEPPKRKRQSKESSSKGSEKPNAKPKSTELSPDEVEVKKLQGQLLKCGVRKIWAFELKEYGDNTKAKIRHLKNLLKEIGMDGRFSEARAREIKERRELEADLEAVKEMDENWGAGRASRSRAARKSFKESSEDDNDGGDGNDKEDGKGDEEDGDADEKSNTRVRGSAKYRADFAFLNDDDESDSD